MLKEIKIEDIIQLASLKQRLRNALVHSHHYGIDSNNIHVFLYFLVLKRDGIIDGLSNLRSEHIKEEFRRRIYDPKNQYSEELRKLHDFFSSSIVRLHDRALVDLLKEFNALNKDILVEHFDDIFDDFLYEFSRLQGPYSGESVQPLELTRFLCGLVNLKKGAKVYNPFAGFASFGVMLGEGTDYVGQELLYQTWAIGALRIHAYQREGNSHFIQGDSVMNWNPTREKFDLIISNPPFNMTLPTGWNGLPDQFRAIEGFVILKGLEDLKEKGKLIVLVPNGFLSSNRSADKELRQNLVADDLLEYVIAFPSGLLQNTGIPFSAIVLNKKKKEKGLVRFIDAKTFVSISGRKNNTLNDYVLNGVLNKDVDSDFLKKVKLEKIASEDFSFTVGRYFLKEISGVYLGDFCAAIRREKRGEVTEGKFVRIRNLKEDNLNFEIEAANVGVAEIPKTAQQINESCLLIAARWKTLKPTYFKFSGTPIFITQDIIALKVDETKIEIGYLVNELQADYVRGQAEAIRGGTTIPYLSLNDLLRIKIELPNLAEQRASLKGVQDANRLAKIKESGLEEELEKFKKIQKDDLSIKKHNIMQHLNNVKASADSLINIMNENDGILDAEFLINPKRGTRVIDSFQRMLMSINESLYHVDNLTNEIEFSKKDVLNLEKLINEAIEHGITDAKLFTVDLYVDERSFQYDENLEDRIVPLVEISRKDFFELYTNILENAINHGFVDRTKHFTVQITLQANLGANSVTVSFANNGKPFPKGMAERYCMKGEKAGETGNTGIGSWKACEIAKYFGGKLVIYDLHEDAFPVKIDLVLPLKNMDEV